MCKRTCVNGVLQRVNIQKEDTGSLSMATESVFMTGGCS